MRLEVLHVPDCPNLSPMLERLTQVTNLPVVTRVIETDADAVRFGMAGSPTLLVEGVDPFAAGECGVSCRLYRDDDGRIGSVPSVEQLRVAISGVEAVVFIGADAGGGPSADCCCDYLNFFTDRTSAETWVVEHTGVPGQIINQSEAETLATRLFAHLLA